MVATALLALLICHAAAASTLSKVGTSPWSDAWTNSLLAGTTWSMKLNVGREPNTRMPEAWAKSGARLLLSSMQVEFQDELVDGDNLPLRWTVEEPACCPARRLKATAGSFVGASGEVTVAVRDGGWLAEPADRCGQRVLRFYLDFPDGAQRNDAVLPAGRVFFNTHCWDGAELATYKAEAEGVEAELDELKAGRLLIPGSQKADTLGYHLEILERSLPKGPVLEGPGNVQLAADGTIAVKANSITNLFGMLGGNAYHQIGKFSLAPLDES